MGSLCSHSVLQCGTEGQRRSQIIVNHILYHDKGNIDHIQLDFLNRRLPSSRFWAQILSTKNPRLQPLYFCSSSFFLLALPIFHVLFLRQCDLQVSRKQENLSFGLFALQSLQELQGLFPKFRLDLQSKEEFQSCVLHEPTINQSIIVFQCCGRTSLSRSNYNLEWKRH